MHLHLPDEIEQALARETEAWPAGRLAEASRRLSSRYRGPASGRPLSDAERAAYGVVRAPATYAATLCALRELAARRPGMAVTSVLDLGAGPGSATWAAAEVFPGLQRVTLVEPDGGLAALGRRLAAHSHHEALRRATWLPKNLERPGAHSPHDIVVASYVFGELPPHKRARALTAAFDAAQAALVVVEPGTPRGFRTVLGLRERLLAAGASLVAPCPHEGPCPMDDPDWCHFAARVNRSARHRRAKGASLGHEDEKFSYVVVARTPGSPAPVRILRHPLKRSGHTHLQLCTPAGLERVTVSRQDVDAYRRSRRAAWGDAWELPLHAGQAD